MRFMGTYGRDGSYGQEQEQRAEDLRDQRDAGTAPGQPAPDAPAPAPSEDPKPGPNSSPAPQGGNPQPPAPPPPAIASSIPGIVGSEATGGVQGSFGQAGTGGFSKRFGQPAAWFRGGPTAGLAREKANVGRGVLAKEGVGGVGGGSSVQNVSAPSSGMEGGGENDEEFQRLMQAVMAQRFGRG